jgi:hypothetical protein
VPTFGRREGDFIVNWIKKEGLLMGLKVDRW